MIPRKLQKDIEASLASFPAVGLIGPRQSGKTTLARVLSGIWEGPVLFLDLESPADLAKLEDAESFLSRYESHLVVIDEAQGRPDLFPILRVLIDKKRRPGRFLLLGSASPVLRRQASESLAGRIAYHELQPFSLGEIGGENPTVLDRLWVRGGYPDSFLAADDGISRQWRENFIRTHLERDLPLFGVRVPSITLRRFWTMAAHAHGQMWNASRIGESLGIDHKTARHYLDILSDTFMIRQLPPCRANVGKQLVKSPKLFVRCSGLLHSLLGIPDWEALQGHPVVGASWEGFIIEQILALVPTSWKASFYRTRSGAEMDMVLHPVSMQAPIAVEIRRSSAPRLTRGNVNALADLAPSMTYVVHPGKDRFPMRDGVEALPACHIGEVFPGKGKQSSD